MSLSLSPGSANELLRGLGDDHEDSDAAMIGEDNLRDAVADDDEEYNFVASDSSQEKDEDD